MLIHSINIFCTGISVVTNWNFNWLKTPYVWVRACVHVCRKRRTQVNQEEFIFNEGCLLNQSNSTCYTYTYITRMKQCNVNVSVHRQQWSHNRCQLTVQLRRNSDRTVPLIDGQDNDTWLSKEQMLSVDVETTVQLLKGHRQTASAAICSLLLC